MKTLPLLLALAIACAHADALFTDPVASKNGLAWLNTETRAATTLTLTRNPDGGETIAVIPSGGTVGVLFVDDGGHFLVKTPFGITGWAQARAGEDSGETFPALKHRHDERLGLDRPPVYEIYDRLLDTAFVRGGARYHMDCTVSLSGQHY